MNTDRQQIWFGLDDIEDLPAQGFSDPKPLYNEKSQPEQDAALKNPEQSIDKDEEKPWVQGNRDSPGPGRDESAEKIQDEYDQHPSLESIMKPDIGKNSQKE